MTHIQCHFLSFTEDTDNTPDLDSVSDGSPSTPPFKKPLDPHVAPHQERKFMVFESALQKILQHVMCLHCALPELSWEERTTGTMLTLVARSIIKTTV